MMPRFLTAAKISLLILIDLYLSDQIPSREKINVLDFIASQVNVPSEYSDDSAERRFKFSASSDLTCLTDVLSQWQSEVPGRSIYDALLQRAWELKDLDAVHVLFRHLNDWIAPIKPKKPTDENGNRTTATVSRSSPLGQFIRRCCVEFTRLQLSDSLILYQSFAFYRASTFSIWAGRNPDAARQHENDKPAWSLTNSSTSNRDQQKHSIETGSAEDAEALLSLSIHALQRVGARVPPSLKRQLSHFTSDLCESGAQSLQHFLSFFEHWRGGQYTMALESLHRYFDSSLVAKGEKNSSGDGSSNGSAAVGGGMKLYYQYALLHLSVLHADFECWGESIEAMEECIATARENQDTACLNFALSWLLYLRQAHPVDASASFQNLTQVAGSGSSDLDEIAFLKNKAREGRQWNLMSSTLLEEAKWDMYGSGGNLNKAYERILQSSFLNVVHDLRTMMPAAMLFQGAALDRLGQNDLSKALYASVLSPKDNGNASHAHVPIGDSVRASCRMAYKLANAGLFDDAFGVLIAARENDELLGVMKLEQRLSAADTIIRLKQCVYSCDLDAANYYLELLAPTRSMGDVEIMFELFVLEIEVLLRSKELQRALHRVNSRLVELKQNPRADIAHRLHLLVLKSRIFAEGSQSTKAFSIALRAAAMAERHFLTSILVEALGILGVILTSLGEFRACKEIVEAALPLALESEDLQMVARLFAYLTEACVGIAGHVCEHSSPERLRNLQMAEACVGRRYEASSYLGDFEAMQSCWVMRARLGRCKGDESSAAQADDKYLGLLSR